MIVPKGFLCWCYYHSLFKVTCLLPIFVRIVHKESALCGGGIKAGGESGTFRVRRALRCFCLRCAVQFSSVQFSSVTSSLSLLFKRRGCDCPSSGANVLHFNILLVMTKTILKHVLNAERFFFFQKFK